MRCACVCLLVALFLAQALAYPRDRDGAEMEVVDDVDFPFEAIDDTVAGIPGSRASSNSRQGFAHDSDEAKAAAPCDMTGSSSNFADGEDPLAGVVPIDDEDSDSTNPTTPTPTSDSTNGNTASVIGSGGVVSGGVDSGVVSSSGVGSGISGVNSSNSSGLSAGGIVSGTNTTGPRSSARNSTVSNGVDPSSGLKKIIGTYPSRSISMSPSPSPSPSAYIPTYREIVSIKSTTLVAHLGMEVCMPIPPSLLPTVRADIDAINLNEKPKIQCTLVKDVEKIASLGDPKQLSAIMESDDFIANALAGYGSASPIRSDATTSTTASMNNLVQLPTSRNASNTGQDTFDTIVRLLKDNVPKNVQCGPNVPPMEALVRSTLYHTHDCYNTTNKAQASHLKQQLLLSLKSSVSQQQNASAISYYISLVKSMQVVFITDNQITVPIGPRNTSRNHTTTLHKRLSKLGSFVSPSPSNAPSASPAPPPSDDDSDSIGAGMNPPLFPNPAPNPREISSSNGDESNDEESEMERVVQSDCDDNGEATDSSAHMASRQDFTKSPGAELKVSIPNTDRVSLPAFGKQDMRVMWESRNTTGVHVMLQPVVENEA